MLLFHVSTSAQTKFSNHKKVTILPAFYTDAVNKEKLDEESEKIKLIGIYKKEIGRDVQYKFYMPLMINQLKYSAFFRGVDTTNLILENQNIILDKSIPINYQTLGQTLQSDAFIILELKETTSNYPGTNRTIITTLLIPQKFYLDKAEAVSKAMDRLKSYTVTLTLTAKIIDVTTGTVLWTESASATNMYYHDAVNELVKIIHKRLPYNKRRNSR